MCYVNKCYVPGNPSKRIYWLWGVALTLLLAAGLLCWLVVVPVWTRPSLADVEAMCVFDETDSDRSHVFLIKGQSVFAQVTRLPRGEGMWLYSRSDLPPVGAQERTLEAFCQAGGSPNAPSVPDTPLLMIELFPGDTAEASREMHFGSGNAQARGVAYEWRWHVVKDEYRVKELPAWVREDERLVKCLFPIRAKQEQKP